MAVLATLGVVGLFSIPSRAADGELLLSDALVQVGYERFWEGRIELGGGDKVAAADLVDQNLYVRTQAGLIYAVQADTGLLRWGTAVGDYAHFGRRPTHVDTDTGDGPLLLVTNTQILALNRFSGEETQRIDLPFVAGGGAVADESGVYLGGADGKVYALRWLDRSSRLPLVRWRVGVAGMVMTEPALTADGLLYFVSDGGVVYCTRTQDKALEWANRLSARVAGGVYVDDSGVYVAATDNRLYVLDRVRGSILQRYLLPGPLYETPVVAQRTVYQYCDGEGLFAFDVDSRKPLWQLSQGRRFVARGTKHVILQDGDDALLFVDGGTGQVRRRVDLPERVVPIRNLRDDVLFLVAADGRMVCTKPIGAALLRPETVAAARSTLTRPAGSSGATGTDIDRSIEPPVASPTLPDDPLRSDSGG